MDAAADGDAPINSSTERYPRCIVWTPIHPITWFAPYVGHLGICDTEGIVHDFAMPYAVTVDNSAPIIVPPHLRRFRAPGPATRSDLRTVAFGSPRRYLPVHPPDDDWDRHVRIAVRCCSFQT